MKDRQISLPKLLIEKKIGYMERKKIQEQEKIKTLLTILKKQPMSVVSLEMKTRIPYGTLRSLLKKLGLEHNVEIITCPRCHGKDRLYQTKK